MNATTTPLIKTHVAKRKAPAMKTKRKYHRINIIIDRRKFGILHEENGIIS